MMTEIFLKLVSMSLMASYCVILICIIRFPLRRVPKIFSYLLWSIVAVRLLCPVSLESNFSLVGERLNAFAENIATVGLPDTSLHSDFSSGESLTDMSFSGNTVNLPVDMVSTSVRPHQNTLSASTVPTQSQALFLRIGAYVWLLGMVVLFGYCAASYLSLYHRLKRLASRTSDYRQTPVYVVDGLDTPFVLGFSHPAIYLPTGLTEQENRSCLTHEYTHIRRKDHIIKLFAFLLACVYWFQPLVWLAFYLMTKDMEMSCDEIALKNGNLEDRKAYSNALVHLASNSDHFPSRRFSGCPLAFGENNVSDRIKNILNFKKPAVWMLIACGVLLAVCTVGLLTNPISSVNTPEPGAEENSLNSDPPTFAALEASSHFIVTTRQKFDEIKTGFRTEWDSYLVTEEGINNSEVDIKLQLAQLTFTLQEDLFQLKVLEEELNTELLVLQKERDDAYLKGADEEQLRVYEPKLEEIIALWEQVIIASQQVGEMLVSLKDRENASDQFIETAKENLDAAEDSFQALLTSYLETGDLHESFTLETDIKAQLTALEADLKAELDALDMKCETYGDTVALLEQVLVLRQELEEALISLNGKTNIVDANLYYNTPDLMWADVSVPALVVRSAPKKDGTVVDTLNEKDIVSIVASGTELLNDSRFSDSFFSDSDIMAEYENYALIVYQLTRGDLYGQQLPISIPAARAGYVLMDGLKIPY